MKKPLKRRGKISISRYFAQFKEGDRVQLLAEPAVQKGIYFRRFHRKAGVVLKKDGRCYLVQIKDQNKIKKVIVHPVHLKRM